MLKERGGYRNWVQEFMLAMEQHEGKNPWVYWMRLGNQPKKDFSYIYLCIGGKIRFRTYNGGIRGEMSPTFASGRSMYGKAWVLLSGPVERPRQPFPMKGFRGYRYTEKLF